MRLMTLNQQESDSELLEMAEPFEMIARRQIRRILVPVDFSESSCTALKSALCFAQHFGAEIILLHVFEPVPGELKIFESAFADPGFREQAAQELAQWQRRIFPPLTATAVFREGRSVCREIIKAAVEFDVDLIVVGKHARKGRTRLSQDSTSEQVARFATCAVLTVN